MSVNEPIEQFSTLTATYSPEDNKLRLYSVSRLPRDLYERVRAAGFIWAPKQQLFVAPMWTPGREDLLIELCGEIGDEDTGLVDRAEERAERFEEYSDNRASDAEAAHAAVKAIAHGIPLGQPILVGHHSERRARKDAERIQNGMRKAVKMWDTAKYWEERAAGALAHAKYKERPDVRHRRIKGIEADKRKQERNKAESEKWLRLWNTEGITLEQARTIANVCWLTCVRLEDGRRYTAYDVLQPDEKRYQDCPSWTVEQVQDRARRVYPKTIAHCERWIAHYDNRIAYERAMLGESGGLAAERFDIQKGGRVLVRGEWSTVMRVNRKDGQIVSVSTNARFVPVRGIEEIDDYQAPSEEAAAAVAKATKLPPLCNYRAPEGLKIPGRWDRKEFEHVPQVEMSKADYARIYKDHKGTRIVENHRIRIAYMQGAKRVCVFLTDEKVKYPPKATSLESPSTPPPAILAPELTEPRPVYRAPEPTEFDAMREQLKTGVQVVSAPQLFPTPPELAERMVEAAQLSEGDRILEPSAGTGRIIDAIIGADKLGHIVAVELSGGLVDMLNAKYGSRTSPPAVEIIRGDFLTQSPGTFDRVLMNPPFEDADDVKHIRHAFEVLKPGGRLVAICANGPRQAKALRPWVEENGGTWEPLPAGTFAESGTNVNTVMLTLDRE